MTAVLYHVSSIKRRFYSIIFYSILFYLFQCSYDDVWRWFNKVHTHWLSYMTLHLITTDSVRRSNQKPSICCCRSWSNWISGWSALKMISRRWRYLAAILLRWTARLSTVGWDERLLSPFMTLSSWSIVFSQNPLDGCAESMQGLSTVPWRITGWAVENFGCGSITMSSGAYQNLVYHDLGVGNSLYSPDLLWGQFGTSESIMVGPGCWEYLVLVYHGGQLRIWSIMMGSLQYQGLIISWWAFEDTRSWPVYHGGSW